VSGAGPKPGPDVFLTIPGGFYPFGPCISGHPLATTDFDATSCFWPAY